MTRISLIRHGEVNNPKDILYGRLPRFPLNQNGELQARRVGHALKDTPLAGIYSSPLLRARQTAIEILKFHPHLKLHQSALINEVKTPFEGQPGKTLASRKGDFYTGVSSPYEQPLDILSRVQSFMWRLRRKYRNQHIVAVTHGDVILFTMLWAKGLPVTPDNKMKLDAPEIVDGYPDYASITTLSYRTAERDERPGVAYHTLENELISIP